MTDEPKNPRHDLPPSMEIPTHDQGMKSCVVGTSTAIHTVQLNGKHFAALVQNQAPCPVGYVTFIDREEWEATKALMENALEDADRLDQGLQPLHAAPELTRQ